MGSRQWLGPIRFVVLEWRVQAIDAELGVIDRHLETLDAARVPVQNARVRLNDDSWICNNCQEVFAVPADMDAVITFQAVAGSRPLRTLRFGDEELHRCITKPKSARFGGRPKKVTAD